MWHTADHSQEMSESGGRRICVVAAVCVCHALLIWALIHGSVIRILPDATAAMEVRIIQEPPRPFKRLLPPGPHLRDLARSSIQLEVPSFDIPTPPNDAIQREPPPANADAGASGGVDSDIGAGSSAGNGTGKVYSPPMFESVPNQIPGQHPYPPTPATPLGDVEMRVCVDEKGKIASVNIVRGSGNKGRDARALDLTRHSRWKVAMVNGEPVFACSDFTVEFARK
jgi:outer membrane biosynthesis protein TonB